jgi:hypothetical protein
MTVMTETTEEVVMIREVEIVEVADKESLQNNLKDC